MTRNQRRRAAMKANTARTARIAQASRANDIALIVKRNLSNPIERNYFSPVSCIGQMESQSHRAYVCRA
jgi:hypothetical protein